jgi:hypothetical protein
MPAVHHPADQDAKAVSRPGEPHDVCSPDSGFHTANFYLSGSFDSTLNLFITINDVWTFSGAFPQICRWQLISPA